MANKGDDSWAEVAVMILILVPVWVYHVISDRKFFNPLSMLKSGWGGQK